MFFRSTPNQQLIKANKRVRSLLASQGILQTRVKNALKKQNEDNSSYKDNNNFNDYSYNLQKHYVKVDTALREYGAKLKSFENKQPLKNFNQNNAIQRFNNTVKKRTNMEKKYEKEILNYLKNLYN